MDCFGMRYNYNEDTAPTSGCKSGRELNPKGWTTHCLSKTLEVLKSGETSEQ